MHFPSQLFSICLIIIGIWALIERQNTINITSYLDVFTEPSIVLIVVGTVSFILGFTGFLGALRENCCLLMFVSTNNQRLANRQGLDVGFHKAFRFILG